ncbi:MAG: hypothetical protein ACRDGM_07780 [bacterium]
MSMTKRVWSVNALSVELDLDRRIIAKRLNGLKPAKVEGQCRLYYLSDVLSALNFSGSELAEAQLPKIVDATVQDLVGYAKLFVLSLHDRALPILGALLKERAGWPAARCWEFVGHYFAVLLHLLEEDLRSEVVIDVERFTLLGKLASSQGQTELNEWLEKLDTQVFSTDYVEKDFHRERRQKLNGRSRTKG